MRPRWLHTLLCLAVWLVPAVLVWLASQLIPVDPDAPANNFGQTGARQQTIVWIVVLGPVIWVLGSKLQGLGYRWLLAAVLGVVAVLALGAWLELPGAPLLVLAVVIPALSAWFLPPAEPVTRAPAP